MMMSLKTNSKQNKICVKSEHTSGDESRPAGELCKLEENCVSPESLENQKRGKKQRRSRHNGKTVDTVGSELTALERPKQLQHCDNSSGQTIKKEIDETSRTERQPSEGRKKQKGRPTKRASVKDDNSCSTTKDDIAGPESKKKPRKRVAATKKKEVKTLPVHTNKVPVADLDLKMKMLEQMGARKKKYIGAHVTVSGGIWSAVPNAVMIGARAFGMFLKNQRQWSAKPLDEEDAKTFRRLLQEYNFSPSLVVPHGSYLMNCGSPNTDILEKSRAMLVDELKRCEMLGLDFFNFHPGSSCGKITPEESVRLIAESINLALEQTEHVTAVLESMSCQGNTIGGRFIELAQIIDRVKDKSRVGVCLDTCHMFAAGYDIKSDVGYEKVLKEFDEVVGFKYLKAVHLNDSKGKLGCHRDLHANIGQGELGIITFKRLMNDPRFDNIPMLLETPDDDDTKWIKLLNSLMD